MKFSRSVKGYTHLNGVKTDDGEEDLQIFAVRYKIKSHNRSGQNVWAECQEKAQNSF